MLADNAIEGFTVNRENLSNALKNNPILVTALNSIIGYEKGAQIAKEANKRNISIREVAREMTDLTDDELDRLLDPAKLVKGGIVK